jgi:hypothetical protein
MVVAGKMTMKSDKAKKKASSSGQSEGKVRKRDGDMNAVR